MMNGTNEGQKAILTPCNFAVLVKQGESAAEGIYNNETQNSWFVSRWIKQPDKEHT